MAKIKVTLSEMTAAANKLQSASESFLSSAQKALSSAEALAGCWEGDANAAFQSEQMKANQWYRQMMDLVHDYIENLKEAREIYETTDEDAAAAIKAC